MAYQTGSINSFADALSTIKTFLQANGWSWSEADSTIYKGSIFINLTTSATRLEARGRLTVNGATSGYVAIGPFNSNNASYTYPVTFPATYYMFLVDDEFYFVVNYDVSRFQYLCFGKSTIDLSVSGGVGTYFSATNPAFTIPNYNRPINTDANGTQNFVGSSNTTAAAPFYASFSYNGNGSMADFVHSGLSADAWSVRHPSTYESVGNKHIGTLSAVQPNAWNGESILMPIRSYKPVLESKISLVLDLQHARHCRIDNLNPAEIISIGPDNWQVFPYHRKDVVNRNGGYGIDHTGTFGWAIRKVD